MVSELESSSFSSPRPLGYFGSGQGGGKRPVSLIVIAMIAILVGAYETLQLWTLEVLLSVMKFQFFALARAWLRGSALWTFFLEVDLLVGGLLGVVLLAGGILTLVAKPWGRRLLIFYAVAHLLTGVASEIYKYVVIVPITAQMRPPVVNGVRNVVVIRGGTFIFHYLGGSVLFKILVSGAVIVIWSCVILYVMTRPGVKGAFYWGRMKEVGDGVA
jgi:hypothetical protein